MNDQSAPPALNLFSGAPQHETFPRLGEVFPTAELTPSKTPHLFPNGPEASMPRHYEFEGEQRGSEDFIRETDTAALLVLKDGALRFERYALTGGRDVCWIS